MGNHLQVLGHQGAGNTRKKGGDRKTHEPILEHMHPDDFGSQVSVPNGHKRPSRTGPNDVLDGKGGGHGQNKRQIV